MPGRPLHTIAPPTPSLLQHNQVGARVLAERFGADNGRIARIILVSTSVSFLTFSAAVNLLT